MTQNISIPGSVECPLLHHVQSTLLLVLEMTRPK